MKQASQLQKMQDTCVNDTLPQKTSQIDNLKISINNSHEDEVSVPQVQERRKRAKSFLNVSIVTSGLGYGRSQLGVAQGSDHRPVGHG